MKNYENKNIEMSVITETGEVETVKKLTPTKKKAILGAAAILGACTLVFGGVTQIALAAETNQVSNVPTTYSATPDQQNLQDFAGYVKGNYEAFLDPDATSKPTANDISMEKAAEIGVKNVWKLFGTNLDGKKIQMTYNAPADKNGRPTWSGWVADETSRGTNKNTTQTQISYSFEIDALSGTVNAVQIARVLPGGTNGVLSQEAMAPSQGYDLNLEKNCQVYQDLARTVTEQNHLIEGNIMSVAYYSQGYTNNDPTVGIAVKSDAGKEIRLEFSRKDKALLGYCSDNWVQEANRIEAEVLAGNEADEVATFAIEEDENGNPVAKLVEVKGNPDVTFYTTTK